MKVHLATAYPTKWSYIPGFRNLAEQDRIGVHSMTDDSAEADVILFVDARHEHGDWRFGELRRHELTRRYPEKCFVYNETDQPWCCMPGLYVSMPKQYFDRSRMRACSYLGVMNPYITEERRRFEAEGGEPDLLFAFAGRRCVPVRDEILKLSHPRALIEDTTDFNFFGKANRSAEEMDEQRRRYARSLLRTKFVLCPRGSGPASFRLFEALAAGRVPVIISDGWVEVEGPDWAACSLRVAEGDAAKLPGIIEAAEPRHEQMSAAASAAWDEWFDPSVIFHRMVDACEQIRRSRRLPERIRRRLIDRRMLRLHARHARGAMRRIIRR